MKRISSGTICVIMGGREHSRSYAGEPHFGATPSLGEDADLETNHAIATGSLITRLTMYMGYVTLTLFGVLRDIFGRLTGISRYRSTLSPDVAKGLAPLYGGWDAFFQRRMYLRIQDCWNRPVSSYPGAHIDVMKRVTTDNNKTLLCVRNKSDRCLNLGSYNYLGFADDWDSTCGGPVRDSLKEYGIACCSPYADVGFTELHEELEKTVADFVGKEDAVVFNMGYGTNRCGIPSLVGPGDLVVSDALNHTSIVNGCRASGASVISFRHNDASSLEKVLSKKFYAGPPASKTGGVKRKFWRRVWVIVEGIYSMEGEVCKLREIVDVAKKFKAYTYVDEAHSIGALGKTGRGVCEHTGVDPSEITCLMGTFTKSFGGMGGYIAGSKKLCDHIRATSSGVLYSMSLSPTVASQIITSFRIIKGEHCPGVGRAKLTQIKMNANYFRKKLKELGCGVLGDRDSPVIPMMLFHPTKIAAFSRECFKRGLAVVVVGPPAVPIDGARARFCISAAHTKNDLKIALKKIRDVCTILNLRYQTSAIG